MRILLDPPKPDSPNFEIDYQIQHAINALKDPHIRIRGAGRFGDGKAAIVLERDPDAPIALDALDQADIRVSVSQLNDGERTNCASPCRLHCQELSSETGEPCFI